MSVSVTRTRSSRTRARAPHTSFAVRLKSPASVFWIACAFLCATFLLGGGSRADILSLIALRPAAVLFAGYAIWVLDDYRIRQFGLPQWLLALLMAWMALQLAPLPHWLWSALPGRDLIVANDRAAGFADLARPLSLSPSRTWNSLFALAVPFATFVLVAACCARRPERLLIPILAMAAVSALLGILQILGPSGGPFHFYRITNPDNPVGLFSNRNHHAIFLASLIPLLTYFALRSDPVERNRPLVLAGAFGSTLLIIPLILVTGSRTGALLLLVSLGFAAVLWLRYPRIQVRDRDRGRQRDRRNSFLAIGAGAATLAVAGATYFASRSVALDRLFESDLNGDLRTRILPQLWEMAVGYFPVGSGFGTFELAYKTVEPFELLRTSYLNQAHSDLIQFVIEGGLPGLLLILALAGWFVVAGLNAWRSDRSAPGLRIAPFAWSSLALLLAGSIADYPLRAPSLMAYAALLCCLASERNKSAATTDDGHRHPSAKRKSLYA